jgi:hypothetical protein
MHGPKGVKGSVTLVQEADTVGQPMAMLPDQRFSIGFCTLLGLQRSQRQGTTFGISASVCFDMPMTVC